MGGERAREREEGRNEVRNGECVSKNEDEQKMLTEGELRDER